MEANESIEEKKRQRESLNIKLKQLHKVRIETLNAYHIVNERYSDTKAEYEALDYEIAMSVRTILSPAGTTKKTPKAPELSVEQIMDIADRLGIQVTVKPEGEK